MKLLLMAVATLFLVGAPVVKTAKASDQQMCCGCCSTGKCGCETCTCCDCGACPACSKK